MSARVAVGLGAVWGLGLLALTACGGGGGEGESDAKGCRAGETSMCSCPNGLNFLVACRPDGTAFAPCTCPMPAMTLAGTTAPSLAGSAAPPVAGTTAMVPPMMTPPMMTPPMMTPPMQTGGAGAAGAGAGAAGSAGMAAAGTSAAGTTAPPADGDFEEARQVCVDTINMYRATVSGIAPLTRATPAQEMCSDLGAKQDGDSGQAHGSAGMCPGLGGQDTCPGWGVGGFSGNATVADAVKNCLAAMWAEGEPPQGREQCEAEFRAGDSACFLMYGHYLNMSRASTTVVSCGFYLMSDGKYWMNQDFN